MAPLIFLLVVLVMSNGINGIAPTRILVDTDVDTDDFFALFYLLKQNQSEFRLEAVTINSNAWSDAGHSVNHIYDILYMMDRDDIRVGVGGDGGISPNGTIFPDVGGYLPLIEQGMSTAGYCRYRQAIPIQNGGRLKVDTNFGMRRSFLPQGDRKYTPLEQPTAQQVMIDTISSGPTTVFLIGAHTNLAIFLMKNLRLKKNIQHIYVMGGGVRSKNPTGCCPRNVNTSCKPQQCGDPGNLFTAYSSNPYAEFNIFGDPFAAYQVIHSGIPVTLIPLDATNTIPINKEFFKEFEQRQETYEAQYSFKSLNFTRVTCRDDEYYGRYFMWDSFTSGVALSIMRNNHKKNGENEFAKMKYLNITVVTSNEPYGVYDGSNPFFDRRRIPMFNLTKGGVHSGHVQDGVLDPFCLVKKKGKGKCKDGYTKEATGPESVRVLVATKAKPNSNRESKLNREFFVSFLDFMNRQEQSGRFNFTTQFPYYNEVLYKPDFSKITRGKPVIFDMDMSAGDFVALIYLLKVPFEVIDLKGILVCANGWANAATIDVIYDVLHMMGRDDIPVGLGNQTALGTPSLGCNYVKAIPNGSGGFIDSDTLFGLARTLPRSPRRYTSEIQTSAMEVWQSVSRTIKPHEKITILVNGPLTNIASIILSDTNSTSVIQEIYVVGGNIIDDQETEGNVFTIPSNKFAEFNMFLDPLAAKTVLESDIHINLIPLKAQRKVTSFPKILKSLQHEKKTLESSFTRGLLSLLHKLQQGHHLYDHMDIFLGEILGAVYMVEKYNLNPVIQAKPFSILYDTITVAGQIYIDERHKNLVHILENFDSELYYSCFANLLSESTQSAVISSFEEQKRRWSVPNETERGHCS